MESTGRQGLTFEGLGIQDPSVLTWEFPKIRGTFLGVPIIRITIYWGSILGSPYFGKLPHNLSKLHK